MLKPAFLYQEELKEKFYEFIQSKHSLYFRFWSYLDFEFKVKQDEWDNISRVSISEENEVIGSIECNIDRQANNAKRIVNYRHNDKKNTVTFLKDVYKFINILFYQYNFNKISLDILS